MYDTIAALATPSASGAIGVIRLSGTDAVAVAGRVFESQQAIPLDKMPARMLCLGHIRDLSGRILDQVLAVVFPGPDSYTGEDVVELHCHGSLPVLSEILRILYEQGARPAEPGEYTKRAFLHGRMDLTQAEAVVDLISAQSADAARNAVGQLEGAVRREIELAWSRVTDLCAHFRAEVDYPEEDIPPLPEADVITVLREVGSTLRELESTYARGRTLREGVPCALIGKPNVGKSSLLNALLGYDRAIVTTQPGTTRDTLVESVNMGGQWLRVADTAGLRDTACDEAERLGIDRARDAAQSAGLVFLVMDGSCEMDAQDRAAMEQVQGLPVIVLVNKDDLPRRIDFGALEESFSHVCPVSAMTGQGLDALDAAIRQVIKQQGPLSYDGSVLTNLRHAETVARAAEATEEAARAVTQGVMPDVVLTELESALTALGEMTGRCISEEIISRVFERFCVGK